MTKKKNKKAYYSSMNKNSSMNNKFVSKKTFDEEVSKEVSKEVSVEANKESDTNMNNLSSILDEDEKLLFSLQSLGTIRKNEKLTETGELLSIDDRWFFQGLRRWWSEDSRTKSANKILLIINSTVKRIRELLEDDYNSLNTKDNNEINNMKEKIVKEQTEERRKLINKYFISISNAKNGIENSRDTYADNFTKNTFSLSIQKIDDILDKLKKFNKMT